MMQIFHRLRDALRARSDSNRLRTRMFSGRALIVEIGRGEGRRSGNLTLLFKNGLLLTLGDEGILDFQDKGFGQFLDSPGFGNRVALALLHKIVLKSLIRYMVQPQIAPDQRERAAEAATKLYLAEVEATTDWMPGPAAAVVHGDVTAGSALRR